MESTGSAYGTGVKNGDGTTANRCGLATVVRYYRPAI